MSDLNKNQKTKIYFELISNILKQAEEEGRYSLYEYEIYELLKNSEFLKIPSSMFLKSNEIYSDEELISLPGDKVVLKIVSPNIFHKTEVGGVIIIEKKAEKIRTARKNMMSDVSDKYASMLENGVIIDPAYVNFSGDKLRESIIKDIKGILLVEYLPYDADAFGTELILGIRNTREFGMIISAGIGGTDTELFAENFRKGRSSVSASTAMTNVSEFLEIFKNTVSYKKITGLTREKKPLTTDAHLLECFSSFIEIGNYFSSSNPEAEYIIEELEINPFAFKGFRMVPLDGLCRFNRTGKILGKRPWKKIENLLQPKSIGIVGVSTTKMNFGRTILNNILAMGYERSNIRLIRPGMDSFEDVQCVPDLVNLDIKLDLLVVAVGSDQVLSVVEQVTGKSVCESVMLIAGGVGETMESTGMAKQISELITKAHSTKDGGPVFLGANCLGVVSHPGKYDTLFIPEEKLPKQRGKHTRNIAIISQSGAFMITRVSKRPELDPAYMISVGNQIDLTIGDMMSYLKDRKDIDVIAVYSEGFKDLDGLNFIKAVKIAVGLGKDVIFYKAGKTPEGKSAASGHTASIAGDYLICETCVSQAGGMVAESFTQFEDLLVLAQRLNKKKINGHRIAAMSGAGFEAVGMADNIKSDTYELKMASLSQETKKAIEELISINNLNYLVDVKNPMDINPAADDRLHIRILEILANDSNVDCVVIGLDPLSPVTRTLPDKPGELGSFISEESIVNLINKAFQRIQKPVVGVVDGGRLYDPMVDVIGSFGIPVFRSSDRAINALAKYINCRIRVNSNQKKEKNRRLKMITE